MPETIMIACAFSLLVIVFVGYLLTKIPGSEKPRNPYKIVPSSSWDFGAQKWRMSWEREDNDE